MSAQYVSLSVINELTQEQKDGLCYIIGDWYSIWKWSLWEDDKCYLDAAIFMLKNAIKWHSKYYADIKLDLSGDNIEIFFSILDMWGVLYPPVRTGERTHNFGHCKEVLKAMICGDYNGNI